MAWIYYFDFFYFQKCIYSGNELNQRGEALNLGRSFVGMMKIKQTSVKKVKTKSFSVQSSESRQQR